MKKKKKSGKRTKKANKKEHLTYEERVKIEGFIKANLKYKEMSEVLKRGASTIYDEIKRNKGFFGYNAKKAHHRAYLKQYRKKRNCNRVALSKFLTRFVERKLRLGWSPERIASRLKFLRSKGRDIEYASFKSIRGYIKKRSGLESLLFYKRVHKKSGPKPNKGGGWLKDAKRLFVDKLPEIKGFGFFEVDFIVSSKSKAVLLVLVDIVTKLTLMRILPNRVNTEVNEAIVEMLAPYDDVRFLIPDNDIAFGLWEELQEKTRTEIFFAKPYTSTDKPLVENTNRWTRSFGIPKKSDLNEVDQSLVDDIQNWFNNTPRECLGGMTAMEKLAQEKGRDIIIENYPRHPVLEPKRGLLSVFGG
jgi:transposase, IS30 family